MVRYLPWLLIVILFVIFPLFSIPVKAVELDVIEQKVLQAVEERQESKNEELRMKNDRNGIRQLVDERQAVNVILWQALGGRLQLRRYQGQLLLSLNLFSP